MASRTIEPRSLAAEDMRDALDYAEWLAVESQARGRELSWDAAVTAAASIVVARTVFYAGDDFECEHDHDDEPPA